jgi:nucleotide-binding universal stress UspA family protein
VTPARERSSATPSDPARTIIDQARRVNADVVSLSTLHAPAGERPLGPLAARLLAERPCRVVIGPPAPPTAVALRAPPQPPWRDPGRYAAKR